MSSRPLDCMAGKNAIISTVCHDDGDLTETRGLWGGHEVRGLETQVSQLFALRIRRLSLGENGFDDVPVALQSADALQDLDMQNQRLGSWPHAAIVHVGHLLTLRDLPDLKKVSVGPGTYPDLTDFKNQRPDVVVAVA